MSSAAAAGAASFILGALPMAPKQDEHIDRYHHSVRRPLGAFE
jgi:hypothetical protein